MKMNNTHRISIPVSDDLQQRLQKNFPWGTQAAVVRRVLELLVAKVEANGYNTIQLLISGKYDPLDEFEKSCIQTKWDAQ